MANYRDGERPPWWGAANVIYADELPELGEDTGWENVATLPSLLVDVITAIGAFSAINSAGMEPTTRMIQQGINRKYPNAIPAPGDLVRFVVREALDPRLREEQMAGFNQESFFSAMAAFGFSQEWSEAYWRAHWDLPSPTQTAEMVHRLRPDRVPKELAFTIEDAEKLFQQADIMPRYIKQLLAITYAPLTRVDIRRIYQLGIMSFDEMVERYKDIGYDPTSAKMLADFTAKDLDPDERDITLGQATAAFREGIISAEELRGIAVEIGLATRAVDLFIRTQVTIKERVEKERAERRAKTLTRLALKTRRASRAGRLVEEDLRMELEDMDLAPPEVEHFIARHVLPTVDKARNLTTSQVLAAYKKDIKTHQETFDNLLALGYDAEEARTLMATATASSKK